MSTPDQFAWEDDDVVILRTAGGPGSGRYPKGSGGHAESDGTLKKGPSGSVSTPDTKSSGVETYDEFDPIDMKRKAFMELTEVGEKGEAHLDTLRKGMQDAWKRWGDDIQNRPRPLKQDGAAAKKLDSYKEAKALEVAFHLQYDQARIERDEATKQAREILKVSPEQRSKVTFNDDQTLHEGIVSNAKRALAVFREFDGSGAFVPTKFDIPADKMKEFREVFGTTAAELKENSDGTFSMPSTIRLSKGTTGRASASIFGIQIAGGRELDQTVFHEVAHLVEMNNSSVLEAAVAFREEMADKPREVYKLNTVKPSLGDDEIAVRGPFPDPYTAKIYPRDVATEIISTGVEAYLTNPIQFVRERPQHFKLIFDVMQGKYRREKTALSMTGGEK